MFYSKITVSRSWKDTVNILKKYNKKINDSFFI